MILGTWGKNIMVIELSGVQFGLESYEWFQSLIWNHKYDLRPKFHDTNCNYHFITAILKSQNSDRTNLLLIHHRVCRKAETKRLLHLILYLKQKWCDIERKWCDLDQKWRDLVHEWRDLQQTWFSAKLNGVIRELITLLRANQIAGITRDFKMDIINILTP